MTVNHMDPPIASLLDGGPSAGELDRTLTIVHVGTKKPQYSRNKAFDAVYQLFAPARDSAAEIKGALSVGKVPRPRRKYKMPTKTTKRTRMRLLHIYCDGEHTKDVTIDDGTNSIRSTVQIESELDRTNAEERRARAERRERFRRLKHDKSSLLYVPKD